MKPSDTRISRRTVIAGATLIPISAIQAAPQEGRPNHQPLFLPEQRRILEAFIDRLVPPDEIGPGAVECGVAEYIDRSLGDYLAAEKADFLNGLAALDAFARGSQGQPFPELSPDKRDAVLTAIDGNQAPNLRGFFNRTRRLTLEGMFSDPYYGGNKNFAGWDMIRYPGVRLAVGPEDQRMKIRRPPIIGPRTEANMAINLKPVDVAVIGLGAAGGVAVLPLTRAGLKVAGLEAGAWIEPSQFKPDELHNNVRRLVTTGRKVWNEIPTFRTNPNQSARRNAVPPMMNAVGGTSIHYDGNSWRFNPWDFKARSEAIRRYGANSIPAGSTLEDWPVAYDNSSHTSTRLNMRSESPARRATFREPSILAATLLKARGGANIQCPRCATRISPITCRLPRKSWVGIRIAGRRLSIRSPMADARDAPTTAIATSADVISAPRIRPR